MNWSEVEREEEVTPDGWVLFFLDSKEAATLRKDGRSTSSALLTLI